MAIASYTRWQPVLYTPRGTAVPNPVDVAHLLSDPDCAWIVAEVALVHNARPLPCGDDWYTHVIDSALEAIRDQTHLALTYRDLSGAITERVVTPETIYVTRDGLIEFRGYCHLRKATRTFIVTSILDFAPLATLPPGAPNPHALTYGDLVRGVTPDALARSLAACAGADGFSTAIYRAG